VTGPTRAERADATGASHAEQSGPTGAAHGERTQPTRHKARKRAVDILFEAELRETDPLETLAVRMTDAAPPVREFTAQLVRGVVGGQPDLDHEIAAHLAEGWTLLRLPRVDRTVLRIATYELTAGETPAPVVIAEAVKLAAELSTDESPAFVNAVLAAISTAHP